jgi:hypothetical protein
LDSTFGTFGRVTTVFGNSNDVCLAVALQSDHKILAAGYTGGNGARDFAIARYDAGPVGVNELNMENEIAAYPNPFTTELLINGTRGKEEVIVYDVLGTEILRQQCSSSQLKINTEKLLPGIYLLAFGKGAGRKILVVKTD